MEQEKQKTGFLIINKQSGPSSFGVISQLRKITGIKKIGHAGTLDPFADGVLLCAIGREATKRIKEFVGLDKEYIAEIFLGAETDTYDRTGSVNYQSPIVNLQLSKIEAVIKKFIGLQKQVPPMYSAVKIQGKKMYELARKGIEVEQRGFSEIEIYDIEILDYKFPGLKIKVKCSSGTYIRSLAYDIGKELGCGAHLKELKRTAVGEFKVKDAVYFDDLNQDNWNYFLFTPSSGVPSGRLP